MKTCTGINCPERTGGECTAGPKTWEDFFDLMYNQEEGLGSSAWFVAPSTVKTFIKGIILSFTDDLDKALNVVHGGGNGRRLLMQIRDKHIIDKK